MEDNTMDNLNVTKFKWLSALFMGALLVYAFCFLAMLIAGAVGIEIGTERWATEEPPWLMFTFSFLIIHLGYGVIKRDLRAIELVERLQAFEGKCADSELANAKFECDDFGLRKEFKSRNVVSVLGVILLMMFVTYGQYHGLSGAEYKDVLYNLYAYLVSTYYVMATIVTAFVCLGLRFVLCGRVVPRVHDHIIKRQEVMLEHLQSRARKA